MTPEPLVQPDRHLPTRDGYDLWAPHYDSDANPLVALEEPIVDALLGDVRGLRVADIGCGTGRHALRLADRGAQVTALDFSDGMLDAARGKPGAQRVRFVAHDIATPLPLEDESFDRVLCALVLDHVADVPALFGELARLCRAAPEAWIVVSVMHPALMLRGVQARFTDPGTGAKTYPASVPNQVGDYVMGALGSGLRLDEMREHLATPELVRVAPRAERYLGWPMLLTMKLTRP